MPSSTIAAHRCGCDAQVRRGKSFACLHLHIAHAMYLACALWNCLRNSTRMDLHGNLAAVLLRMGDPNGTVRECSRALELADAHPDT
jgi:hypothetical protein